MEEKKLTDEEIVKALECCSGGITGETCKNCPLNLSNSGVEACYYDDTILEKYALDLINRQKAEIERLTEEKWQAQDDLDNYHAMYQEEVKANAELQKQVDELRAENGRLHKIIVEEMVSVKAVRAAKSCPTAMKMLAESVGCVQKDTAKEIFQELYNETIKDGIPAVYCMLTPKEIKDRAKRYGVEVE